jgi:hypothetical protein
MIISLFCFESPQIEVSSTVTKEESISTKVITKPDQINETITTEIIEKRIIDEIKFYDNKSISYMIQFTSWCHELISAIIVVNIQFMPYISLFPLFFLFKYSINIWDSIYHWSNACIILALHNIFCAVLKIK